MPFGGEGDVFFAEQLEAILLLFGSSFTYNVLFLAVSTIMLFHVL